MTNGTTVKGKPLAGSAPTSSSRVTGNGQGAVVTSSAPLQNATKTVGSEPHLWEDVGATTF